jgi:hypothetical protein
MIFCGMADTWDPAGVEGECLREESECVFQIEMLRFTLNPSQGAFLKLPALVLIFTFHII